MHPLSTALLLVGYALALPLAARLPSIVRNQQRLALLGHQGGLMVAMIGWLTRGAYTLAGVHAVIMIVVKIWFDLAGRRLQQRPSRHDGLTA